MRVILALVATILALIGLVVWLTLQSRPPGERASPAPDGEGEPIAGTAVDSLARIQMAELEEHVFRLEEHLAALNEEVLALRVDLARAQQAAEPPEAVPLEEGALTAPQGEIEDYASTVVIPDRRNVNRGLTVASPDFLVDFLGRPRDQLSDRCEPMTNQQLRGMLVLGEVGPIRVWMLEPALESLGRVFEAIKAIDPDLHDRINTAGSLCVRQIRGALGRVSNHSFGLAVDINIDGQLDVLGDGLTQVGLLLISDVFREEGWIWGAAFSREDSMHFEVSRERLEQWREEGRV